MALRRRLRHKLLLGLLSVVASVGLLLAGTLYGLSSYAKTMKLADSKTVELHKCSSLIRAIDKLGKTTDDRNLVEGRLAAVTARLADYELALAETVRRGRDPSPDDEQELAADLRRAVADYRDALEGTLGPGVVTGARSRSLTEAGAIEAAHRRLAELSNTLYVDIGDTLYRRFDDAKHDYRLSAWLAGLACATAAGLLLLVGQQFRGWVFRPVAALQAGVQRVAAGRFEEPIALRSGDELQELADGFDAMTARLNAMYRDLARQVNERSRQLVRSERMVSVGFLAAGVSHEINNPLASIAFCAEALQRRVKPLLGHADDNGEVISRYLKMVQDEAFRCKQITSKLLEFSRAGERKRAPEDLAALVQSVLEIAQHLKSCQGKEVHFRPLGPAVAPVNAEDLKSVILNLVVNALDSMDEGGVLTITLRPAGEWAEVTFADTGCGMDAGTLEHLFEPFYTRSRTGKGTGLGLFISHQIVDQHNGSIEASSPGPGQGSTFVVRVPLRPAVPMEHAHGHAA